MQLPTLPKVPARWQRSALIALVVALLLLGYLLFGRSGGQTQSLTVMRADVPKEVAIAGSVIAKSSSDLGFAESGRIKGTYASVGAHVAAGTVLAEIDNGQEIAAVAKAQADLDTLTAGTRPEQIAIDQAAVDSAKDALVSAIRTAYVSADDAVVNRADLIFRNPGSSPTLIFANYADLKDKLESERRTLIETLREWQSSLAVLTPASAQSEAATAAANLAFIETFLDNAATALTQALSGQASDATIAADESSVASARTNVAAADTALSNARSALTSALSTLALANAGSARGDIAAGRADLADREAALRATRVIAPFDGVVTKMDAKVGEIVSPGTSQIAMQSDSAYEVEVYIPEVSIAGVAVGNLATTTLDAYGASVPFTAKVVSVDPAETEKDGVPTYKTTLAFVGNDARIRSGMTANVVITIGTLQDAIVVPSGAVGHDASGAYVLVKAGHQSEHRAVTTGETPSLGQVEITTGLSSGETILLSPS